MRAISKDSIHPSLQHHRLLRRRILTQSRQSTRPTCLCLLESPHINRHRIRILGPIRRNREWMINHTDLRELNVDIIAWVVRLERLKSILGDEDDGEDIGFLVERADRVGGDGARLDEFGDKPIGEVEAYGGEDVVPDHVVREMHECAHKGDDGENSVQSDEEEVAASPDLGNCRYSQTQQCRLS